MKRVAWTIMSLTDSIGWSGLLSIPIFAWAGILYLLALAPLQSELETLAKQSVITQADLTPATPQSSEPDQEQDSRVRENLEDYLRQIHESGTAAGLPIKRMEYRMVEHADAGPLQYQIAMPLTHAYPAIRIFIADVLHRVPALSLDQISLSRKRIGDPVVEADLRFTLFLSEGR